MVCAAAAVDSDDCDAVEQSDCVCLGGEEYGGQCSAADHNTQWCYLVDSDGGECSDASDGGGGSWSEKACQRGPSTCEVLVAAESSAVCKCVPDEAPVKIIGYSGNTKCAACFASSGEAGNTGEMSTEFKIKKNTFSFLMSGDPSAMNYVKLTVKNSKVAKASKALEGMPFITQTVSGVGWYPVEWDVSSYVGETAVLTVKDFDPNASVAVDSFGQFNDKHECLPSCMKIQDDTCAGETCFYFENDEVPYTKVKAVDEGISGMYCRAGSRKAGGSPIGPGIEAMSVGGSGQVFARTSYLTASTIPRCLNIDPRGSHYAISVAETTLGDDGAKMTYAYSPSNMGEKASCVYETLKPRCVAYSKPSVAYKVVKRLPCKAEMYKATCFDSCYAIHCADTGKSACGKAKAFQDCARCCGSNNNVASGCFRRRRRLGAAVEEVATVAEGFKSMYTENECASRCLDDMTCIAWMLENGACMLGSFCDSSLDMDPENPGSQGFEKGTWNVWKDLKPKDITSIPKPAKEQKKNKKKKKKK